MPSQLMPSRITRVWASVLRSRSVSSIRSTKVPPVLRAKSQLKSAVRAPPTWRYPVGDGANLTRTILLLLLHDPEEEQHELQHQDEDDGELEELAARDRDLLDGKAIDVVERLQLVLDALFPARETEA